MFQGRLYRALVFSFLILGALLLGGIKIVDWFSSRSNPQTSPKLPKSLTTHSSLPQLPPHTSTPSLSPTLQPTESFQVTLVGDLMFDRDVRRFIDRSGVDYPFRNSSNLLSPSDLVIGNLEGPMTDLGESAVVNGPLIFHFDQQVAQELATAGFQAVSLANNHTYNHGVAGLDDTKKALTAASVQFFGDPREPTSGAVWSTTLHGQRLALIGWNTIEVTDIREAAVLDLLRSTKQTNDFVIVMPHWGVEYQTQTSQQVRLAHDLIDAGADVVIGSHPHVVQGIEVYHDHLILYSLGNFIFDQFFSEETQQGLAVHLNFSSNQLSIDLVPVDLHKAQPKPADPATATKVLQRIADQSAHALSAAIAAGHLMLTQSGTISP